MRITHQVADKENSRCTQDEGNVVVRQEEQHADGGHDQQTKDDRITSPKKTLYGFRVWMSAHDARRSVPANVSTRNTAHAIEDMA